MVLFWPATVGLQTNCIVTVWPLLLKWMWVLLSSWVLTGLQLLHSLVQLPAGDSRRRLGTEHLQLAFQAANLLHVAFIHFCLPVCELQTQHARSKLKEDISNNRKRRLQLSWLLACKFTTILECCASIVTKLSKLSNIHDSHCAQ